MLKQFNKFIFLNILEHSYQKLHLKENKILSGNNQSAYDNSQNINLSHNKDFNGY